MFLKFRYRLGYETLCREVADSFTWRRFCRIPLDGSVPHPTTLMKLTTRCGPAAVDGLNRGVAGQGRRGEGAAHQTGFGRTPRWCRRTWRTRPTPGCWPRRYAGSACGANGSTRPAARSAPGCGTGPDRPGQGARGRGEAAVPGTTGPRRGQGRRAEDHRGAGRPGQAPRSGARKLLVNARRAAHRAAPRRPGRPPRCPDRGGRATPRTTGPGGQRPDRAGRGDRADHRADPATPAGSLRTERPGWSACTTPRPGRSPRAGWASPSSSVTRRRLSTTTTASSWTTPSSWATRPTRRSSRPRSTGSEPDRAGSRAP